MNISKITLGTAQLGFNYGIANVSGKPNYDSSIRILEYAWNSGITSFDTAPSYGNSEIILGSFIKKKRINPIIITKLPTIDIKKKITNENLYKNLKSHINKSLKRLNINKIPIYLIHNAKDIYIKNGLVIEILNQLKEEGLIDKIGISIYNPDEAEFSLKFKEIKVIQVPINIFDHRLINTGILNKLNDKGCIILARSIYLQGLFFIDPNRLPNHLQIAKNPLEKINKIISEYNINIAKLAFLFIRKLPEITSMIIGIENVHQLSSAIELLNSKPLTQDIIDRIYSDFSNLPEELINPSMW